MSRGNYGNYSGGVPKLRTGCQICYSTSMSTDEELEQLRHENQTLREGLKQALLAIDYLQERVKE